MICAYCGEGYGKEEILSRGPSHGMCSICGPFVLDAMEDEGLQAEAGLVEGPGDERERLKVLFSALRKAEIPAYASSTGLMVPSEYGHLMGLGDDFREAALAPVPMFLLQIEGVRVYYGDMDLGSVSCLIRRIVGEGVRS